MTTSPEGLSLSFEERHSPLLATLRAHYHAKLAVLRARNDGPMDEASRNRLLGRIAEVKAFLDLGEDHPLMAAP